MQGLHGSLPADSGCREHGSGMKPITPVQSRKRKAMARSSLCYPAKGLVIPGFPNFILRAAGSQQKLVSMYSQLIWESTLHASAPANWGEHRAVPCITLGSLPPYLHRWQLCWAPAALRQLLNPRTCWVRWEERWVRWEERRHFAMLPPAQPCLYRTKCLRSTETGPDQPALQSFHFRNEHTSRASPNAIFSSLHWVGSQTLL